MGTYAPINSEPWSDSASQQSPLKASCLDTILAEMTCEWSENWFPILTRLDRQKSEIPAHVMYVRNFRCVDML